MFLAASLQLHCKICEESSTWSLLHQLSQTKGLESMTWIKGTIITQKTSSIAKSLVFFFPGKNRNPSNLSINENRLVDSFPLGCPVLDPGKDGIGLFWRRHGRWRSTTKTTQAVTISWRTRRGPAALLHKKGHTSLLAQMLRLIINNQKNKIKHTQPLHPTSLEITLTFSTCPHLGGFGSQTIWPPCATNAGFTIGSSHRSPPNSVAPPKTSQRTESKALFFSSCWRFWEVKWWFFQQCFNS